MAIANRPVAFLIYFSTTEDYQVRQLAEDLRKRGIQALAWPRVTDQKWDKLQKEVERHSVSPTVFAIALGQPASDREAKEVAAHARRLLNKIEIEVGEAMVLGLSDSSPIPKELQAARFLDLSGDNYAARLEELARSLGALRRRRTTGAAHRYSVVSGIFEVARPQSAMFAELKAQIQGGQIDQKYLYWDVRAALRWQGIAELSSYLTAQSSMNLLAANVDRMLDGISQDAVGPRFSFINFGVGTGVKDFLILDRLLRSASDAEVLYFPVDESLSMIQITIQSMQELMLEYGDRLNIQFVLDDFANAQQFGQHIEKHEAERFGGQPVNRILGFLGGSIGNFVELDVLPQLRHLMRKPQDRLILGVEFIAGRKPRELAANYEDLRMRRFLFGPIQDVEGHTPNWDKDFHNEVVEGWSNVPGAQTIVGQVYYGSNFVELFRATKYEREELESFLGGAGFVIHDVFLSDDDPARFGKYVLSISR